MKFPNQEKFKYKDHHISHIQFKRYPLSDITLEAKACINLSYYKAEYHADHLWDFLLCIEL